MLSLSMNGTPTWKGHPLPLPPKERSVLSLLLRHRPNPVGKEEIIQYAWPFQSSVSDASIARCINQIRRALPQICIEAIYGFGYKLLPESVPTYDFLAEISHAAPEIGEQFLHAMDLTRQRTITGLSQALEIFREITRAHPDYVPARLMLAQTIGVIIALGLSRHLHTHILEAWEHVRTASQLAPDAPLLSTAHAWLCDLEWNFSEADALHQTSLKTMPHIPDVLLPHVWHLIATNRVDQALQTQQAIVKQHPYSPYARITLARMLSYSGRINEALQEVLLARKSHPNNLIVENSYIYYLATVSPNPDLLERARYLNTLDDLPTSLKLSYPYVLACCGCNDHAYDAINAVLRNTNDLETRLVLTNAMLKLGDMEGAATEIMSAYQARYARLPYILRSPLHAPLKQFPRMQEIWFDIFGKYA